RSPRPRAPTSTCRSAPSCASGSISRSSCRCGSGLGALAPDAVDEHVHAVQRLPALESLADFFCDANRARVVRPDQTDQGVGADGFEAVQDGGARRFCRKSPAPFRLPDDPAHFEAVSTFGIPQAGAPDDLVRGFLDDGPLPVAKQMPMTE